MKQASLDSILIELGKEARREQSPRVRVETRVLETLTLYAEESAPSLGWFAAASFAVASAAIYVAAPMLFELTDPMSSIFRAAAL